MIHSMTAFASRRGAYEGAVWDWDLRSVNGRGLELRLRLPEGIDGLEGNVRAALAARLARGSVTVTLRLTRGPQEAIPAVDPDQLDRVLAGLAQVQDRAAVLGLTLAQATAADVLAHKGVLTTAFRDGEADDGLAAALLADLDAALDDFVAVRATEGAALAALIEGQVLQIERLTEAGSAAAEARRDEAAAALTAALRRLVADVPEVEEGRLAQELALIAVRADVTEEIDRLRVHVAAARDLVADLRPAGRRLDFLLQEFNREANTLCSKAGSAALTRVGLDLKATIDQMREQVQNVE